jgi:hypothetical protein
MLSGKNGKLVTGNAIRNKIQAILPILSRNSLPRLILLLKFNISSSGDLHENDY